MRILIAETDLNALRVMQRSLEEAGHLVVSAMDGLAAWQELSSVLLSALTPDA